MVNSGISVTPQAAPSPPVAQKAVLRQTMSNLRSRICTPIYPSICNHAALRPSYLYEAALLCGRLYLYLAALRRDRLTPNLPMADDLTESARTGKQ